MRAPSKQVRSRVFSLRISPAQTQRLQRKARQLGRTPSETGAMLIEEGLRRADFSFIDFWDSSVGRQAYILGRRLAVWQVISLVRAFRGRVEKVAAHLGWPEMKVRAAMSYAEAFPGEIEEAIADAGAIGASDLRRIVPQVEEVVVPLRRR
jgi:uncharacterized protein (DUF433 family)